MSKAEKIGVSIRLRPINQREAERNETPKWDAIGGNQVVRVKGDYEAFDYDAVFDSRDDNEAVYDRVVAPVVKSALEGYNATCFAYGQTASGKTHTIHGSGNVPGVLSFAIRDIFTHIDECPNREFLLGISFLEIYNESMLDLLTGSSDSQLKIRQNAKGVVYVENLGEKLVKDEEQIAALIADGERRRHVGETNMNSRSSRSHVIFRLNICSKARDGTETATQSHLNFVDLAGSEKSEAAGTTGLRLAEGCAINKSLSALTTVIRQLSEGSAHVSYRDSRLTRILQNSLGGNARVALIATASPVDHNDTKSTLLFAQRAKKVETKAVINQLQASEDNLLYRYQQQIRELQNQLALMKGKKTEPKADESETGNDKESEMASMLMEHEALKKKLANMSEFMLMSSVVLPTDADAEGPEPRIRSRPAKNRRHTLCPGLLAGRSNLISFPSPTLKARPPT